MYCCWLSQFNTAHFESCACCEQVCGCVFTRYYGCGLVAPDELLGLDVLDLGCGVGVDVFLLSKFVGPAGHVIGIDMTAEQVRTSFQHNTQRLRTQANKLRT